MVIRAPRSFSLSLFAETGILPVLEGQYFMEKTPAVGSVVKVLEEFRFSMNILCEDDPDHRRLGAETEE